jgi:hypothetical protein
MDLTDVMRRASVLGLLGMARSFSIQSTKRLMSLVVTLPMVVFSGRKLVSKRTSERKALIVFGERP